MTPAEQRQLDKVADRLGHLYQRVGHLCPDDEDCSLKWASIVEEWSSILDELNNLTAYVERISDRKSRVVKRGKAT